MTESGSIEFLGSFGAISIVILLVLLLFSVASWAIIIYKWRLFRLVAWEEREFLNAYARAQQDEEELRRLAGQLKTSPSAAVFLGIVDRVSTERDAGPSGPFAAVPNDDLSTEAVALERHYLGRVVEYLLQGQITRQEAYLPFLATTGNITPFIGLLGTVVGIINAFTEIGRQGTASLAAVAPGVAEALVATAAGLFTAIPAVIAYNYFLTRIRNSAFHMEAFSIELLNALLVRVKQVGVRG
ncbi:MotA/TolQ/ExbB proton channel family protein [Nitrospiraceae bacterium AH_259_D15_M11_P09]|nr:MotA/TolQ/ExbB proton channel family protein [Nitrospiraceae bacterium AH_259_D15_M11_P09]